MARSRKLEQGEGWKLVRNCANCGRVESECVCESGGVAADGPPSARLRLEKRRGKSVTVVALSGMDGDAMRALVKELKGACATGGTLKGSEAELQGDHRDRIRKLLAGGGIPAKG